MRLFKVYFAGLFISFLIVSCKVSETQKVSEVREEVIVSESDTVTADVEEKVQLALYKGERTRQFKLIHTKLEVSFDWEKQWLHGKALLIVEPYFYEQSSIILDAKGFVIHEVALIEGEKRIALNYDYDLKKLIIDLGKQYQKKQRLNLSINYTAKPNENVSEDETEISKKGLYFINPLGKDIGKPTQVWTHGETETNSRWFPTIDAPNQKTTQEIFIKVDNKFKTLSNGTLIYSKSNADGTRTDYWKMDQPHAPYLFMMAVGDFAVVEDDWKGKKVDYYVEREYEAYADDIFGNTPEMMSYFSELLNYPFPWDKYSQVVVRDFVSGAMENTTASVFMEDLQITNRELLDYNWDYIIAHELFHQWFGDLLTCESWANVALNESFATYGEYLWINHQYGQGEGQYHLQSELETYLNEAETKKEDLIRFYYDDDEEMFDSHSYAKGGLILHLLRNYLGDDAFFGSLQYYLKSHAFGKVEVHDLRMAFEHISGEDLNWFFNQWFFSSGHPSLKIEESMENGSFVVKVWQEQDIDLYPVYKLPLTLDIWQSGRKIQYLIEIDKPYQEFEFNDIENPNLVLLDSDFILVGEKDHLKTAEQFQFQYEHYNNNVRARMEALTYFLKDPYDSISQIVIADALKDSFWSLREEALSVFEDDSSEYFLQHENMIKTMAMNDPHTLVRASALSVLSSKDRADYIDIFKSNLGDSSYSVAGQALYAYLQSGVEGGVEDVVNSFRSETNFNISSSIADYYIQNQDHEQFDWFTLRINKYFGADLWYFIKLFGMYLITAPQDQIEKGVRELENIAKHHSQYFNRLSAYQSLELLSDFEGVPEILAQIKENEKDSRLKDYYQQ